MKLKNLILLGAALMIAVPAVTTLPGCGGGNSGVNTQIVNGLQVNLGNGQTGTLNLTFVGTQLTGQLIVPAPLVLKGATVTPRAIAFTLPPGTYNLTGTFAPPRGFTAQGSYQDGDGLTVNFTLTGQVPTTSREGTFTFTAKGQSVTGTIPRLGQGNATATPTTNADAISGNITNGLNSNVNAVSFSLTLQSSSLSNTPNQRIFTAIYRKADVAITRSLSFTVRPTLDLAVGQSFSLAGTPTTGTLSYSEVDNVAVGGASKSWDSTSGTLRIDAIQGDKITFTITNSRLQAPGTDAATGSFTLSGSGQARTSFDAE